MIIQAIKWEVTSKTQNTKYVWLAAFLNLNQNIQITIPENVVNYFEEDHSCHIDN